MANCHWLDDPALEKAETHGNALQVESVLTSNSPLIQHELRLIPRDRRVDSRGIVYRDDLRLKVQDIRGYHPLLLRIEDKAIDDTVYDGITVTDGKRPFP
jgi:hypothetical protein